MLDSSALTIYDESEDEDKTEADNCEEAVETTLEGGDATFEATEQQDTVVQNSSGQSGSHSTSPGTGFKIFNNYNFYQN